MDVRHGRHLPGVLSEREVAQTVSEQLMHAQHPTPTTHYAQHNTHYSGATARVFFGVLSSGSDADGTRPRICSIGRGCAIE